MYKNLFYKNAEPSEIVPEHAKNMHNLRLRDKTFLFICIEIKTRSKQHELLSSSIFFV